MKELREILEACRAADLAGRTAVLATVVRVSGSTYRRPGARMLFEAGRESVGLVSGGCLESDLAERAAAVMESGEGRIVVYDMKSPDDIVWGLGLGCNGEVQVLLEPLLPGRHPAYLELLNDGLAAREACVLVTLLEVTGTAVQVGGRLWVGPGDRTQGRLADGDLERAILADARQALARRRSSMKAYGDSGTRFHAFLEFVTPPPSLLVFGAGQDALPLVRFAASLGWIVTVVDCRPGHARPERFPEASAVRLVDFDRLAKSALAIDARTAAIVMTHHFVHDLELLKFLLQSPAPYVGLLGPRQRASRLMAELERRGVALSPEQLERLHAPLGLDIGAEAPEEIALAAMAEIQAAFTHRAGGFLRESTRPLHDWPV